MTKKQTAEPAYVTLARRLRDEALALQSAEEQQLPTEAELVDRYGVSRQTVRRAFQELVAEGVVYRVRGRGTFPARNGRDDRDDRYRRRFGSIDDLMALSIDSTFELVIPLCRRVNLEAASRLRLSSDSVRMLAFLRLYNDAPFCVTTVFLPPRIGELVESVPELTEVGTRSSLTVISLLDARLPEPIAEAEQSITAAGATREVARTLHCDEHDPVLRIDRTYYLSTGEPVELAISYFLPDQYSYRVRLHRDGNSAR
jgi:DNA-binding GntR family transcriptional regulator